MSGIYIPGLEMPTTCGRCWFCHAVGIDKWHCRLTGTSFASYSVGWGSENNTGDNGQHPYIRLDNCPLIPVPEHGDLIDRNETVKTLAHDYAYAAADIVRNEIPTIIPADEEAEK